METKRAYRCIMADPPWQPLDALPGATRGASKNYRTLSTPAIRDFLRANEIAVATSAILFLWRLASMQRDALDVAEAWGFRVVSEVVWKKLTKTGLQHFGMGRTVRASHETALIAVRGPASSVICSHGVRSLFEAPIPLDAAGDVLHSAKPDEFVSQIVDPLIGSGGPRLELFARKRRNGWDAIGDQLPESATT